MEVNPECPKCPKVSVILFGIGAFTIGLVVIPIIGLLGALWNAIKMCRECGWHGYDYTEAKDHAIGFAFLMIPFFGSYIVTKMFHEGKVR